MFKQFLSKAKYLPIAGLPMYLYSGNISTYLLNKLDPELSHDIAIKCLSNDIVPFTKYYKSNKLKNVVFGNEFKNPVGMAAGFDKNAQAYNALEKIGFGFVEVGSVTALPQEGNPKPRIFRKSDYILNNCGLNNHGLLEIKERLDNNKPIGKIGISLSAGNTSNCNNSISNDFYNLITNLEKHANYFVLNISCPNVLQRNYDLDYLLETCRGYTNKPLLIKVSPNLQKEEYIRISHLCLDNNIDGIIISNTLKTLEGSKSGSKDLDKLSNEIISLVYRETSGDLPIIGSGGIMTPEQAFRKIEYGASLIQIYSGFIKNGPDFVYDINKYIGIKLKKEKKNIKDIIGRKA